MESESLKALKDIRDICYGMTNVFDKDLDTIENEINELYETIDTLEKKCSLLDYWRNNCLKNDKVLEILKECPFVLHSIYENTNNVDYIKRYGFGTITDSRLEIIKRWLEL